MSPCTADAALKLAAMVWHGVPGTMLLGGAVAVPVALARVALHQRHTLHLPPPALMRIGFGPTIPLLRFDHVIDTPGAFGRYRAAAQHQRVVAGLLRDGHTRRQLALLAPGWRQVCMGMNMGLRHRTVCKGPAVLLAFAIALPLTAATDGAVTRELTALQQGMQQPFAVRVGPAQRQSPTDFRTHWRVACLGFVAWVLTGLQRASTSIAL